MSRCISIRISLARSLVVAAGLALLACSGGTPAEPTKDAPKKPAGTNAGAGSGGTTSGSSPEAATPDSDTGGTVKDDAGVIDSPAIPPDGDGDYIFPERIHSGFGGATIFRVPIATTLKGADLAWMVADPAIATIAAAAAPNDSELYDEDLPSWAILTTKKAGTTRVMASAGGKTSTADVIVTAYAPAQMAAGKARYTTAGAADRVACASCHEKADGADHSPTRLAAYDDANVVSAITTAKYGDGYPLGLKTHKWALTDAEKTGIMGYLRSLSPRGF
jgi:hypothetical protein